MQSVREPARDTPVAAAADVVVAGAGPAGVSAALCAARQGASVILLEQAGAVGGIATVGLMSHWVGRTQAGGIYDEIIARSHTPGHAVHLIDPERLKAVLLDMLEEAGVDLRLYHFIAAPIMEGRQVAGVITESKSGRRAFLGKVVVDATGDGDVAARAGAPFVSGRASDGKMQPMTLMFKVAGVDMDRAVLPGSFEDERLVPAGPIQQLGRQHLPHPAGHVLLYPATLPGVVTVNMTNCIGVDGASADDLTAAERCCRQQIPQIVEFLRAFVPGFADCYLVSSAALMGVRETRHILGDYLLTTDDVAEARVFSDWVVCESQFNFDIHNVDGAGLDEDGAQRDFRQPAGYTIPYRCLLPQNVEGLLTAGRCISGTHKAHSNYRVMPICASMGQAAGIAAALCARADMLPRALDSARVQAVLTAQGIAPAGTVTTGSGG
jgi:glycine/D-amino acid oxidase-like deaminating enzyme